MERDEMRAQIRKATADLMYGISEEFDANDLGAAVQARLASDASTDAYVKELLERVVTLEDMLGDMAGTAVRETSSYEQARRGYKRSRSGTESVGPK